MHGKHPSHWIYFSPLSREYPILLVNKSFNDFAHGFHRFQRPGKPEWSFMLYSKIKSNYCKADKDCSLVYVPNNLLALKFAQHYYAKFHF